MYFDNGDHRIPLKNNTSVLLYDETGHAMEYIIDAPAGSGGFALMYIAHEKNDPHRYVALKELFPRTLDNAVAERRADGRIVLHHPLTESDATDREDLWQQITPYFEREVRLTRRAAVLYDTDGNHLAQNNPDVFGIGGPYLAENGNRYLTIDTHNGCSLQQFIDNGWEMPEDRGVFRNNLLYEILGLLRKTTQTLTALHGDRRMYHLDLSPANLYIRCINGGQDFEPTIIDYGSAYDRDDPSDRDSHRFTSNPYSAPEIRALAELNDPNSGYCADGTSDTYSIAAILFYAVLGELYSVRNVRDLSWQKTLVKLYPEPIYGDFAEKLTDFFQQGLSADQSERYVTIQPSVVRRQDSLADALYDLQNACKGREAGLLKSIPDDELMSYLLLDKYPLYRYCGSDGHLHVLCLGSGVFVHRMILSILSTGQMIGRKLYIHVVSGDAGQYRQKLLDQALLLASYADFEGTSVSAENCRVFFTFETVPDLTGEEACRKTAEKYGPLCRYVVLSLGSNNRNITLARRFAMEIGRVSDEKTILNYYMAEDAAQNIRSDAEESIIPSHVEVLPFGNRLPSFGKEADRLGEKAFRVHFLYEKIYNPGASEDKAVRNFLADAYSQRSSAAAAVHTDYKLASIHLFGSDPKPLTAAEQRTLIKNYRRYLRDPAKYGQLLQLEHLRWMFFMIADGYRFPSPQDHERYSFRYVNGTFNKAFKCTADGVKTHHCLVPCGDGGICLPEEDHREWDKYRSAEEIRASGWDALDQVSLYVHMLAGERMRRPTTIGRIRSIVEYDLRDLLYSAPDDRSLEDEYEQFREWILEVLEHCSPDGLNGKLKHLTEEFALRGIDIRKITRQLSDELAVFVEFQAYKDYKKPDKTIIDYLLWTRFSENCAFGEFPDSP